MSMKVTVIYHYEAGSWWAESPSVQRWTAAADELEQLIPLVEEGVRFALETEDVAITHMPDADLLDVFAGRTAGARVRLEVRDAFTALLEPVHDSVPNQTVLVAA